MVNFENEWNKPHIENKVWFGGEGEGNRMHSRDWNGGEGGGGYMKSRLYFFFFLCHEEVETAPSLPNRAAGCLWQKARDSRRLKTAKQTSLEDTVDRTTPHRVTRQSSSVTIFLLLSSVFSELIAVQRTKSEETKATRRVAAANEKSLVTEGTVEDGNPRRRMRLNPIESPKV